MCQLPKSPLRRRKNMKASEKMKKWLSILLSICMLLQYIPAPVFAAAEDTLCEHHPEHTAECGYEEGVSECTYHCDICLGHSHEESEPSAEAPAEDESDILPAEAACACGTDDESIHATTCPAYVAPENPVCHCTEKCGVETQNLWCDVCGFDYTACGGEGEAASYVTNPTGKAGLLYTGSDQVLINATPADTGYQWGYFAYGYSGDPMFILPEEWEPPARTEVDQYYVHCIHIPDTITGIQELISYCGQNKVTLTVYIYPAVTTAPVAATGLSANGSAQTLISAEGVPAGGYGPDMLYSVTSGSATSPGSFSTSLPTATEAGTYKVWYKARSQSATEWGMKRLTITAPNSAAQYITVTIAPGATSQITWILEGETYATTSQTAGQKLTLPAEPSKAPSDCVSYTFDGWFTAAQGGEQVTAETVYSANTGTTYYGRFKKVNTHDPALASYSANGFCPNGCYTPATDSNSDGIYEIANGGQMFWFAEQINSGALARDTGAILTADINLEYRDWVTICSTGLYYDTTTYSDTGYTGTFDGNGHTISNYSVKGISGTKCSVGLFGTLKGKVQNLGVTNMTFQLNGATDVRAAAIAGQMLEDSSILNCYVTNSTLAPKNFIVGGIAACNYGGSIFNCFTYNVTVDANARCGNLVSDCRGDIGVDDRSGIVFSCWTDAARVTGTQIPSGYLNILGCQANASAALASGEAAWYLNNSSSEGIWKQTIGTDVHPNFTGKTVYYGYETCVSTEKVYTNIPVSDTVPGHTVGEEGYTPGTNGTHSSTCPTCGKVTTGNCSGGTATCEAQAVCEICGGSYGNTNPANHDSTVDYDNNGFCPNGCYEPAVLNNGVYEISNAGQLYWFARQVNIEGNTAANAKLMADIDLENRVWYPIGLYNDIAVEGGNPVTVAFSGSLDGNFHTVSNFTAIGTGSQGLVGYTPDNDVSIRNLGVINATVSGWNAGAVLAYYGTVENCYAMNCTITASSTVDTAGVYAGAVAGTQQAKVNNCFAMNCTVSAGADESVWTLAPVGGKTVTNSYYGNVTATTGTLRANSGEQEKTSAQFASGEVAYLLGTAWGQTIGTDAYPIPGGEKVYEITVCEKTTYSNTDGDIPHDFDEKGFCTAISGETHYQPATDSNADGVYEIANAGQLYWFAQNGGHTSAVLTADIAVNRNVLAEMAKETPDPSGFRQWVPINNGYSGTFDGQGHSISGLYYNGTGDKVGLFGSVNDGTVQNLGILDSYFCTTGDNVGAVVGRTDYTSYVFNCYSDSTVIGDYYVGGIVGNNDYAFVRNSYFIGTVSSTTSYVGGIVGRDNHGTSANAGGVYDSFYLNTCGTSRYGTAKTAEQFASGEVAYQMSQGKNGSVWGQTIGTDSYPVLGGEKVYEITVCEKTGYSNTDEDIPHNFDEKGFCTAISGETHYQPAVDSDSDGCYEISNAGQLFWFAQQVNVEGNREIKGILTADIDLEERPWTPIGSTSENSNNFRGVFDGDGHTIRGLYVEGGRAGLGFFGEVRTGTVKNFTIYGEVVANTDVNYVGGVIGSACGLNSNKPDHNGAIIQNITSYVNLTAKTHGIGMVGGFVGYANHETLIENCSWYGTFDAGEYRVDSGAGGFVGRIYDTATVTIRNCGAYGTVKTAYQSGTYENYATIYIGGFLSYSPSGAKTVLANNLWAGTIINNTNLDPANANLSAYGTMNSDASKTNCYALDSVPYITTGNDNKGGITTVTAGQLKSGEVAYLLSQGTGGEIWGQKLGTQNYPVLGGDKVYYGYDTCDEKVGMVYSNASLTDTRPAHTPEADDGDCTTAVACGVCGETAVEAAEHNFENKLTCGNDGCEVQAAISFSINGGREYGYMELQDAIDRAASCRHTDGAVVKLLKSFDLGTDYQDITAGVFTLDLNDQYIQTEKFGQGVLNILGNAEVTVRGGRIHNTSGYGMTVKGEGKLTVAGGEIISEGNGAGIYTEGEKTSLKITGGTISGRRGVHVYQGDLSITGGTVIGQDEVVSVAKTEATIEGGTFRQENAVQLKNPRILYVNQGAKLTVTGGSFSGAGHDVNIWDGSVILDVGAIFPGGIAVSGTTLQDILASGAAYWQGEKNMIPTEGQKEISGGDVVIKAACPHANVTDDDDCTTALVCPVCSGVIAPAKTHDFGSDGKCLNDGCSTIGYNLWVGGQQFTDGKLTITDADGGTATYAPETNTLTLNDYSYEGVGYDYYGDVWAIGSLDERPLKLVLQGESAVSVTGAETDYSYGVYTVGDLEISGTGSLTATGGNANSRSCGVYTSGTLTVTGGSLTGNGGGEANFSYGVYAVTGIEVTGGSLTGNGGDANDYSYGVHTDGTLTVTGGSLTGNGGEADMSYGVYAADTVTVSETGKLMGTGGNADSSSYGVQAGTVEVTGGSLTGNAGNTNGYSYGVYAANTVTVSETGSLTGTGGNANYNSYGVYTEGTLVVSGGSLTGTGGGEANTSYGVYAADTVTVSETGSLTGTGGNADSYSYGVYTDGTLVVSGGSLTGIGCGEANMSYGVEAVTAVEVTGGSLTGTGGDVNSSYGVCTDGTITVSGGSLTGTGGNADGYSYGVQADAVEVTGGSLTGIGGSSTAQYSSRGVDTSGTLTVTGGSLTGTGGEAQFSSYGVEAEDTVTVSETGKLTAAGGEADRSYGAYTSGTLTVTGGSLTATGGNANMYSYGVEATTAIEVTGGSLTGTGGNANYISYGVYTNGTLTVTGGSLSGTSGDATNFSYGVYASNTITVSGGSLMAASGTVTKYRSYGVYAVNELNLGENIHILTPAGGSFDDSWHTVVDAEGNCATEVEIGKGYTVSVDAEGGTVTGAGVYTEGASVTLTITPDIGCELRSVTAMYGDSIAVNGKLSDNTYTFTMPAGNVTVTVTLERLFTPYDLWVGGERFTSARLTINGTTGTAAYDPETNTLTLDGYTYEGSGHTWEEEKWDGTQTYNKLGAAIYCGGTEPLNLVLKGDSVVTHTGDGYTCSFGLFPNSNMVVTEDSSGGSLMVSGGAATESSYGVVFWTSFDENSEPVGGRLTLLSGSLTGNGGTGDFSYGVYTDGTITVSGGSLTGNGGTGDFSFGVCTDGTITVSGGSLTGNGGEGGKVNNSYGVYAARIITVSGGSLTGNAGAAQNSGGVYTDGDLEISGTGILKGNAGNDGYGLTVWGTLTMGVDIHILTPEGGSFDDSQHTVVDAEGNRATEVEIGKGYTVSVDAEGGTVSGAGGYAEGASVTLTITPDEGYALESLTVDGVDVTASLQNGTYTFTMPAKAVAVSAAFVKVRTYELWVGGQQFTDGKLTITDADGGTATYAPETNTLTLNDYTYEGAGYKDAAVYYSGTDTLELALKNDNSVTHTGSSRSYGMYADNGSIIISGTGSLTANGGNADSFSYGVRTYGTLTVTGGSLTGNAGNANSYSYGVYAADTVTVSETGSLTGNAGNANYYSYGVYTSGTLVVSGGSLTGTGGETDMSYGVYAADTVTVSETGSLTGTGGNENYNSYGVYTDGTLAVSGGSLTGNGGNADGYSYGVQAGAVEVTGGSLTGNAGNAYYDSYGVYAADTVTVSETGSLTATGGSLGVYVSGLTMGVDIHILTPAGGSFDDSQYTVVDAEGNRATEVEIGKGYTVSVSVAANGTVSGAGGYAEGASVTLTITPDEGYALESLIVDGEDVTADVADGTYTFSMPAEDVIVVATFVQTFIKYDLWVGGEQFTEENLTITGGDGTATYDPETNTLTLNNYTYTGAGYAYGNGISIAICYKGLDTLNLVLEGENSVTHTDSAVRLGYGVFVNRDLHISGTGSLNATGSDSSGDSYGINADNITMAGGTVTATGGKAGNYSFGVFADGGITITGGSLTGIGGKSEYQSVGIYVYSDLTVSSGALTAIGGETTYNGSYGVAIFGSLSMGEGIHILTPAGGSFDDSQYTVVDAEGNSATEVEIGAACDHSGNENQYTDCTEDFICSVCEQVITEAKENHNYVNHFCSECGYEEDVYVSFYSLSLKGNIAVNYYMHISEKALAEENGFMRFITPRGGTVDIPLSSATVKTAGEQSYYVFSASVAAKEMTDTITGQYFYGESSSAAYDYSVKQYADILIAGADSNASFAKAAPMIEAMLVYGAYAQTGFAYNTDKLAHELTDVSSVTMETLQSFANPAEQGTAHAPFYGATLMLKTETAMRLYFQPDDTVAGLTASMNGTALTATPNAGMLFVSVDNISAKDLDETYTVTINDGTETAEVSYNPMTYCYNVLKSPEGAVEESMRNTVRALYLYNQAANAYFINN